jgi:hypothetical protein
VYTQYAADRVLQRLKKEYADPSTKQNKSKIDEELADIRNIMKKNISEVLERGEKLDRMLEHEFLCLTAALCFSLLHCRRVSRVFQTRRGFQEVPMEC